MIAAAIVEVAGLGGASKTLIIYQASLSFKMLEKPENFRRGRPC